MNDKKKPLEFTYEDARRPSEIPPETRPRCPKCGHERGGTLCLRAHL